MKKLLMATVLGLAVLTLTACAEVPEGVDQNFHTQAMEIFTEVDDDTMEMDWEGADADDIAKVNTMSALANSEREIVFSESLDKMVELQPAVVDGDREALKQYLQHRATAMDTMNLDDTGNGEKFQVSAFQFGEEQD
jgi:hypothetical protein